MRISYSSIVPGRTFDRPAAVTKVGYSMPADSLALWGGMTTVKLW